jgi:RND family efflux transporter MFP subunit
MKNKYLSKYNIVVFLFVTILTACTKQDPNKASLPTESSKEAKTSSTDKKQSENKTTEPEKLNPPTVTKQNSQENQNNIINTALDSDSVPRIPATIKAENQSSIGFLTSGAITNIYVRAGDEVKQGQVLASLEDNQASIDVKTAKIEVGKKKIAVEQQEKIVQRIDKQYKSGIVNLATLEKEKNTLQLNILELQSGQATLEGKEYILKSNKLFAPYTGVISKVSKSIGDYVATGTEVFQITQTKNYKLFAQVPITYFNQLKVGMKLDVRNPITGNHGEATIKRVVPVIDPTSRTFDVYADVTSFTDKLAPGVFLEIKLKSK